jgi:hypothetical protein
MALLTSAALPGWAVRLVAELDAADARARALAETMTVDQLNWRARPGTWSVGQCLEHLAVANELYLGEMQAALLRQPGGGPVDDLRLGAPSRWFIDRYIAPSPARAKAPAKIAPAVVVGADVLERFLRSTARAREVIRSAAGADVNRLRFRNPFVPLIRFTVGTGFEILAKHAERHLLQAERVRAASTFPAAV